MSPTLNGPCPCGSGKKYKRCCNRNGDRAPDGASTLYQRIVAGELPFGVRVSSSGGDSSQIAVLQASVTRDGRTTALLHDTLTLATNVSSGDKSDRSAASLSIPIDGTLPGTIKTFGNASVSNEASPARLSLGGGKRELKKKSRTGLFAVARIALQRDSNQQYFDLIFGTEGQSEERDEMGSKKRPHIAFFPDGNGKFIRLAEHLCELESHLKYLPSERRVLPDIVKVRFIKHQECVELHFIQTSDEQVVLDDLQFVDAG